MSFSYVIYIVVLARDILKKYATYTGGWSYHSGNATFKTMAIYQTLPAERAKRARLKLVFEL